MFLQAFTFCPYFLNTLYKHNTQWGGANFRFDELSQDHGILHFVIGTSGIQNPLLVKSGNSGFLIFQKNGKIG